MAINKCRVCYNKFFKEPLLRYSNMPKAAQHFPSETELTTECGTDLEVCQCTACGLVQLNNDPVSYYKEVIRAAAFSEEMRGFRSEQFKNFVNKYSLKNKRVVEIGCGKGEFLSLMREAETEAFGIEYGDESVAACRAEGLSVLKFYIENETDIIGRAPFDCFFIMNFFEHLPDPNTTLKVLYNNLTDDGLGLIEVPNFDMILENSLFSEFINDHLFYFTRETLESTLTRNGFEIVECEEVWYKYIISAVVRKRKRTDTTNFYTQQAKIKNDLKRLFSKYKEAPVAVYGAGHQALAVLALADISAIVIMAASYSDEVASKLMQRRLGDVDIYILRDDGLENLTI